jgi:hypothetical protein
LGCRLHSSREEPDPIRPFAFKLDSGQGIIIIPLVILHVSSQINWRITLGRQHQGQHNSAHPAVAIEEGVNAFELHMHNRHPGYDRKDHLLLFRGRISEKGLQTIHAGLHIFSGWRDISRFVYVCPPSNPILFGSELPRRPVIVHAIHQTRMEFFYKIAIDCGSAVLPNFFQPVFQCHDIVPCDMDIRRHAFIATCGLIGQKVVNI